VADVFQEKWMKGVAVTATVFAVMTAIASSRGGAYGAKIQLLTAVEGSQWNYYQAKSIKQHLAEMESGDLKGNILGTVTPEQKSYFESKLTQVQENIARYDKEKSEIKDEAETSGKQNAIYGRRANQMSLAVVFFQIAIMLTTVSALLKRKEMWYIGLVLGCVAFVYLANGLFLFF
jgi:hypothetical protein